MRDMKKTTDKVAASVTVYQVADMTTKGRKAVCGWLRKLADDLSRVGFNRIFYRFIIDIINRTIHYCSAVFPIAHVE